MALDISDMDVLARFDTLVENGIIYYGPTNAIALLDKDFPVSLPIFEVETHYQFLCRVPVRRGSRQIVIT
jgi:hypothetical protein